MSALREHGLHGAPSLDDLPPPPPGRTGWPWDEAGPRPEDERVEAPWPRITVVTPSYNQAPFLEETIRSVLLQGYPDLEYIVMDGGSTDGSVEIIRKYSPWLAFWTSGPDRGQSDAINSGFRRGTGAIMAWLNSDDSYCPGALWEVADRLGKSGSDILIGAMEKMEDGPEGIRVVKRSSATKGRSIHPIGILAHGRRHLFHFIQPPMFWKRALWQRTGELDTRYHYVMDLEWCNRALAEGATVATSERVLARFRVHPEAKTQHHLPRALQEHALMYWRLSGDRRFRRAACLLASAGPLRRSLVLRAERSKMADRPASTLLLRLGAVAVQGCERGVSRLYRPGPASEPIPWEAAADGGVHGAANAAVRPTSSARNE
jgi:GT2 family glycosyltransferase